MQKRIPKGQARTSPSSIVAAVQQSYFSEPFREKLSNGITVVGENITSVESIAIGVWINFGSRDERREENGITHFVEHMVFKGTEHFTGEELVEEIEGRGGYINAFTTKEFSCYYAKVFKEDIEPTIRVLSDLIIYPKFEDRDLRNERKVVFSEMQEVYDDPEDWGMDFVEEKIFAGNSLSMPIIGRASSLKKFTSEDLRLFHLRNFTAGRIVVSVAGNFDRNTLMKLVDRYFSPTKASSKIFIRRKPALNSGGRLVNHRDTGRQAHFLLSVPGSGLSDPDRYATSMVGVILGDGSSSRLYKSVREKDGLVYSIYSYGSAYGDSGILGIYACAAVKDLSEAEERILSTINEFVKNGPTKEEVMRAKAQLKAGIVFSLENLWDRASLFARDELYYKERSNVSETLASIEKVTDVEIAEAAKSYLTKESMTSLRILPAKSKVGRRSRSRERKIENGSRITERD
jgi:predicted Zn-dependent peptidase